MIGQAIGEVLAFGVGVAMSPLAIVAVVVLLVARGGALPAWTFTGTWVVSLSLASALVLLLADGADASAGGEPATWVSILKIVVGLLLVLFGVRSLAERVSGEPETEAPGWMRKLDNVTTAKAAGLAVLFVVKPKNLLLTIGAGIAVAQVGVAPAAQVVGVAAFVALGTVGLAIPLAIHVLMPRRGRDVLTRLREWMASENATIIAVLCLVIAAKLLGDALVSLTS
jgi:Sap, sulfolipid-1-addressing protein